MKTGHTLTALVLTLALVLPLAPARAAEEDGGLLLPAVNAYAGFLDVAAGDWFYDGVRTCYEAGLMNGTGDGEFTPEGVMTTAEAATIAARLGATVAGDTIPPGGEGAVWYAPYLDYLRWKAPELEAVVAAEPERAATRSEFFGLLAAVTPKDLLAPINSIDALPDVDHGDPVLDFYNAGILTGVDENGTFAGDRTLTRAECAVMTARLADPAQRKVGVVPTTVGWTGVGDGPSGSVTASQPSAAPEATPSPAPLTPSPAPDTPVPEPSAPADDSAVVMTVNGQDISKTRFIQILNQIVYDVDYNLYQQGSRLDWSRDYGVGDLRTHFLDQAAAEALSYAIQDEQAAKLGCTAAELPAKLYGDPGYDVLSAFAREQDILCAKHILVDSQESANAVLDGLKAVPTLEQFNALLYIFGTDPGMKDGNNPDGYLFTSGMMVSEFEAGTRELEIGDYSKAPVQSSYGYHIIWRLDPAAHPQLLTQYQHSKFWEQMNVWAQEATVTLDKNAILSIDPRVCYEAYLNQ